MKKKKCSNVFIIFVLLLGITFQEVQLLLEVRKENLITQLRSRWPSNIKMMSATLLTIIHIRTQL